MGSTVQELVEESVAAVGFLKSMEALKFIEAAAALLVERFKAGSKVLIAGNGGSLCDAVHFAEELTGFLSSLRRAPLPAIALADAGYISCVANDIGYEWVFARGVEAYGKEGDVFIALTTSGNSLSILHAVEAAKKRKLHTVSLLGKGGGEMRGKSDLELIVEGVATSDRIQEAHMAALHILATLVEQQLFQAVEANWN